MDSWLSLIPGPMPASPGTPPVPTDDEWAGEQQRLIAMQWHLAAVRRGSPNYDPDPEIFRITAEPLPWKPGDLAWALRSLSEAGIDDDGQAYCLPAVIAQQIPLDMLAAYGPVLSAVLGELLDGNAEFPAEIRRPLAERYGRALARLTGELPPHLLFHGDRFGTAARDRLGERVADPATIAALEFAVTLTRPVPAKAWSRRAETLLTGAPQAVAAVRDVLRVFAEAAAWVYDDHDVLLRGLCWMAALDPADETTALLARVAEVAGVPRGRSADPRAARTAAAAVEALVERPGVEPARTLARLAVATRSKPLRARARTALDRIGAAHGWAQGEAQELAVDDHGLDRDGRRSWPAPGGHTLVVEIIDGKATVRAWRDGRPLKSLPAAVRDHAGPAKALAKEINKTLAVERARVEDLLSADRTWEWETWQERYLRHPVTGALGRRLIWQTPADHQAWVTGLPEQTATGWSVGGHGGPGWVVRLWHPVLAAPDEVAAWRDRITTATVRQPFKQAFREVYRLTPAEEQTRVYSNRFAGHILRYRQANALMRVRGWSANFLGPWDSGHHSEATRELAGGDWRVAFWHEAAGTIEGRSDQVEFCSTDQVRFARRDGRLWEPAPITEVPPRVLSEAMRDVDLFVGVTSIAADDSWADRGEHPFRAYWAEAGFGALTGGAEVRRDVLARLLPRLAIGPRCELTDRFLRVRGTRAIYKIHLGSGNILMEPDDAYLCVVPGGRATRVSLPFDDDERLSLILSKALLLAADDKITDASILRQLPGVSRG
ncbi:DUF4132 domain-containing protein [Actinoplanes aureus]|uniref:DUF4132 domain-containing protein n=1 Tax=Actinoplanes aureus TaxID=2792083 RepID=A0A931CB04_9ACTN|nr:DUF4132 domain-containing protein [Actinoplanes aureus]MBG0564647.1 DUF4132 domain-containing protein [Actinoplanes aureus]